MTQLTTSEISKFSRILTDAYFEAREIERITNIREFSIDDAYRIQDSVVGELLARGDRLSGFKMGLTSKAKMRQMGVHSPIYGVLTEKMHLASGARLPLRGRIHPKIEPEIAFLLGRDLSGEVTPEQALEACSAACAAMEVIDSRYKNFNFTLPDVVADNCSGAAYVLGEWVRHPAKLDLGNLGILMEVDGKPVQFGSAAAIYGHPAASLAELCSMLHQRGAGGLKAGQVVLAGAATQAIPLEAGAEIKTSVQDLGSVSLFCKN